MQQTLENYWHILAAKAVKYQSTSGHVHADLFLYAEQQAASDKVHAVLCHEDKPCTQKLDVRGKCAADLGGLKGAWMSPMRCMGKAATALATRAALLADEGVRMASAGDSGALAACLGNNSLMVFHSTVLMQIGAPAHHSMVDASLLNPEGNSLCVTSSYSNFRAQTSC